MSPSDRKQELKKQTKVNPHSRRSIIKADREVRDKNRAKNPVSPTRVAQQAANKSKYQSIEENIDRIKVFSPRPGAGEEETKQQLPPRRISMATQKRLARVNNQSISSLNNSKLSLLNQIDEEHK